MVDPAPMNDDRAGSPRDKIGVVIVDHGSRRAESNALLEDVAAMFRSRGEFLVVEPAHMELAEPSLATAFNRCVAAGAELIVIHPYFLAPGKHWQEDIPALAAAAAAAHPGIRHVVTAPLGLHPLMAEMMQERIEECLAEQTGEEDASI